MNSIHLSTITLLLYPPLFYYKTDTGGVQYWPTDTMKARYSTLTDLLEQDVGIKMCLIYEYAHPQSQQSFISQFLFCLLEVG